MVGHGDLGGGGRDRSGHCNTGQFGVKYGTNCVPVEVHFELAREPEEEGDKCGGRGD